MYDAIFDKIHALITENQQLKDRIKTYEEPEDLTLMFMYCDEKAKDKIKQYKSVLDEIREVINKMIYQGYIDDEIQYFATGNKSGFGIRANVLLQILDKVKESE